MNHTPGPWTAEPTEDLGVYRIAEIDERHSQLVKRGNHKQARAEDAANALLISAAPDMLAALRQVAEYLEGEAEGVGDDADAVLKECLCAIAMAERG